MRRSVVKAWSVVVIFVTKGVLVLRSVEIHRIIEEYTDATFHNPSQALLYPCKSGCDHKFGEILENSLYLELIFQRGGVLDF